MRALKRYKYHLLAAAALIALMFVGVRTKMNPAAPTAVDLPKIEIAPQRVQALELFRPSKASLALNVELGQDLRAFILNTVRHALPDADRAHAYQIARSVISEANRQHMDPLFLLAVITTESQFNIHARGTHGEVGLMQVLPRTAQWLAKEAGLAAGFNLEDPATNIRVGATYLAHLRHTFRRRGKRYVAAYNMGPLNVRRLLAQRTEPTVYPARVINNYEQIYSAVGSTVGTPVSRGVASVR